MEYEDEGGYPGSVPEFGAIFMSNCATKKECHRRKLLGLPSAQANFVKRVKAGMVLFIFEFEKRELYGVYRASTDGAMNIVPHAFNSSGKQFPAQVRFTVIWHCNPLSEHEFRDAISENYYSNKKFKFGLSQDQVHKLLLLFSLRKFENRVPRTQFSGLTSLTEKERALGDEKVSLRSRLKFVEEDSLAHNISASQRPENEKFTENSLGYDSLTDHEGTSLGRRKRIGADSMNLMEDKLDFDSDVCAEYRHPTSSGDLGHSLYSSRRKIKESQILFCDNVETEDIGDACVSTSDFLARRDLRDGIVQMRDARRDKYSQSDDAYRLGKQTESFDIPQTELKGPIYDQRLFMDRKVDFDHNSVGGPKSIISANQVSNSLAKVRRISDDGRIHFSDKTDIGRSMYNGISPIVSDRLERVTEDCRQIPVEQSSSHLDYGGKFNYQVSQPHMNNGLRLITSAMQSGHPFDGKKGSDDNHMLPKSGGVEDAYTLGNDGGRPLSMRCADLYQPRQPPSSFNSSKSMLEAHYSLSQSQHKTSSLFPRSVEQRMYLTSYPSSSAMEKNKHGVSYPTSRNSVPTRSVPYDQELLEVDGTSHSVKDFVQHYSHVGSNLAAPVRPSPYCMGAEDNPQSDGDLRHVSQVPMRDNRYPYDHNRRVVKSLLSGGYRETMEQPLITNEIHGGMLPFPRSPIYDGRNVSPSIELSDHDLASERVNHNFLENVTDPASSDYQDLVVKYGIDRAHLGFSIEKFDEYDNGSYQDPDAIPTDPKNRRTSVFTRLSLPSRKHGQEHEGYREHNVLDASVDQVMETVHESLGQNITNTTMYSPFGKRHNTEGTLETKKRREKRFSQKVVDDPTIDKPIVMTQKMVIECKPVTNDKENAADVLKETRVVEFKRRSETSRRQNGGKGKGFVEQAFEQEIEGSVQKPEGKREGERGGKQLKRRKLVRPVLGKKEEMNGVPKGDECLNSQLTSSNCNRAAICDTGLGDRNCLSHNSQVCKKLVGPVFGEEELNDDHKGVGHSNPQFTVSDWSKAASCDFSGTSLENPSRPSPNSQVHKKLVRPSFSKKEDSNDSSKIDGISDLKLLLAHEN